LRRLHTVIKQITNNKPKTPAPVAPETRTALTLFTSTATLKNRQL
jgi:hypothetical protein